MLDVLLQLVPSVVGGLLLVVDVLATGHALLHRREVQSTIAWVGFIWLVPVLGPVLYLLLGINRIRRRAQSLRPREETRTAQAPSLPRPPSAVLDGHPYLGALVTLVDRLVGQPLTASNKVELLINGDQAFPAMIDAIDQAQRSIGLTTYIFDSDRAGQQFVQALARAVKRGVAVRVLLDDAGARYSRPRARKVLRAAGVPAAHFLPTLVPRRFAYVNLRSHRKIMVVDGRIGFTGGMNIREGNQLALQPAPGYPIQDIHARMEGPIVTSLRQVFADDWAFSTEEQLGGEAWAPPLQSAGTVVARGIPDGPDEDFEQLRLTFLGALTVAKRRARIVTPYFLPDSSLITALNVAAMRGVVVDIVLPAQGNLRLVQWATWAMLWQVLERGCHVWLTPPPFDHSKLVVVDDAWVLIGSGNWDARSLRLNFEFNVECYDATLAMHINELVNERIQRGRELTLQEVDGRSLPVRIRDGVARLFTPYL